MSRVQDIQLAGKMTKALLPFHEVSRDLPICDPCRWQGPQVSQHFKCRPQFVPVLLPTHLFHRLWEHDVMRRQADLIIRILCAGLRVNLPYKALIRVPTGREPEHD